MPFNPPNWKKLVEKSLLTYTITDAVLGINVQSDPYWVLCPQCYSELFLGLQKYRDETVTEVKKIPSHFAASTADYQSNVPILKVTAQELNDTYVTVDTVE